MTLSTGRTYSKVYPSLSIITLSYFATPVCRQLTGLCEDLQLLFDPLRTSTRMHLLTVDRKCQSCAEWHVTSPDLMLHFVIF